MCCDHQNARCNILYDVSAVKLFPWVNPLHNWKLVTDLGFRSKVISPSPNRMVVQKQYCITFVYIVNIAYANLQRVCERLTINTSVLWVGGRGRGSV